MSIESLVSNSMNATSTLLLQDQLTLLPLAQGWLLSLPGGQFPADGILLSIAITGMAEINERFGCVEGDLVIRAISRRILHCLPGAVVMRGIGVNFYAWLAEASDAAGPVYRTDLQETICASSIIIGEGEDIYPQIRLQTMPVVQGQSAIDTIETLEHTHLLRPDATATPVATALSSPVEQLNAQLDAMRFAGQAGMVEAIFARLDLPALHPETVLLVGPPQSGKMRLLTTLAQLVEGQQTPVALVICRTANQEVPYRVMVSLIRRFLSFYPRQEMEQRFETIRRQFPWLGRLFTTLACPPMPPLPEDLSQLRRGLEALLREMTSRHPHIAVIRDFQFADQESLIMLSALQCTAGHGLRIIADVEQSNSLAVLHHMAKHNAGVMMLQPFTPDKVQGYLAQMLPDIALPEVAAALHAASGGRRVAIERTLAPLGTCRHPHSRRWALELPPGRAGRAGGNRGTISTRGTGRQRTIHAIMAVFAGHHGAAAVRSDRPVVAAASATAAGFGKSHREDQSGGWSGNGLHPGG